MNITRAFEGSLYCRETGERITVHADGLDELKAKLNGYIENHGKLWTVTKPTIASKLGELMAWLGGLL